MKTLLSTFALILVVGALSACSNNRAQPAPAPSGGATAQPAYAPPSGQPAPAPSGAACGAGGKACG